MTNPVERRLIKAGLMDADTGATRSAKAVRCRTCRRSVLRGISADWGGLSVDVDPAPLSRLGEVLALLADRATFELRWLGDRYEIDRRDQFRIRGNPAGTNGVDVLVRHDCVMSNGPPLPTTDSQLSDDIVNAPILSDIPPY
jgi:hypothetical protein